MTNFVKRTLKKQTNNSLTDSFPSRDEIIKKHKSRKGPSLPPLRETITVVTERNGKYEPYTIHFEDLISEYSDSITLLQEFQIGIESWAKHKSINSISTLSFDVYLRSFLDFVRVIRSKKKIQHIVEITPHIMQNYKVFLDSKKKIYPEGSCYQYVKLYIQEIQQSKFRELPIIGSWKGNFPSNFPRNNKPKEGLSNNIYDQVVIVIKDIFNTTSILVISAPLKFMRLTPFHYKSH